MKLSHVDCKQTDCVSVQTENETKDCKSVSVCVWVSVVSLFNSSVQRKLHSQKLFFAWQVSVSLGVGDHGLVVADEVQRGADQGLVFCSEAETRSQLDAGGGQCFTGRFHIPHPTSRPVLGCGLRFCTSDVSLITASVRKMQESRLFPRIWQKKLRQGLVQATLFEVS